MSYFPVLLEVGISKTSTPQPSSIVGVKSGLGCCVADGVIGGIEPIMGGIGVVRLKGTIKWGCQDIGERLQHIIRVPTSIQNHVDSWPSGPLNIRKGSTIVTKSNGIWEHSLAKGRTSLSPSFTW